MLLSILIPTLPCRAEMFEVLYAELVNQICRLSRETYTFVEIRQDARDKPVTVGAKRQALLDQAAGQFIVFIDDDDWINPEYLSSIIEALQTNPDVVGFGGHMTQDGKFDRAFKISAEYKYSQDAQFYYRYFNHLSPIRREIALKIGYKDKMYGEDYDYSMRLRSSRLIKSHVYIDKDMYHYRFSMQNSQTQNHANR